MTALDLFPLARYRLEWRVTAPVRLPDYAGSLLRGAFGHALRSLACMTRAKACDGCDLISTCPYPALFAPPAPASHALQKFSQVPVPYVIEPPEWGAKVLAEGAVFSFNQVLVGRALRELPLVILAWRRALGRGIGAGDGRAELLRVVHCAEGGETEIHRPETGALLDHERKVSLRSTAVADARRATLRFHTPLRLQQNGRALPPGKLDARTLLMALARRASLLAEFHCGAPLIEDFAQLSAACAGLREEKRLAWRDWTRYSSRQQQKMALGGVVGEWALEGELAPFLQLLRLGEWLHVGKETAFGLGRYTLLAAGAEHISPPDGISREHETQPIAGKEEKPYPQSA